VADHFPCRRNDASVEVNDLINLGIINAQARPCHRCADSRFGAFNGIFTPLLSTYAAETVFWQSMQ